MNERLPLLLLAGFVVLGLGQYRQGKRLERLAQEHALDDVALSTGAAAKPGSPAEAKALNARIHKLEQQVQSLRRPGRSGPKTGDRRPVSGSSRANRGLGMDDGNIGSADLVEILDSDDPEVRDALSDVIRSEMDNHREDRRAERRARWDARTHELVNGFAEKHGLGDSQRQELVTALFDERAQISGWFEEARKDHTFGEAREKAHTLREETNDKVAENLSEEQGEAFRQLREEEQQRRYGGRH